MINPQNHNIDLRRRARRNGFTLIEVMISVALVLLLMYGVSQVFKLTGDAVGANQAVSKIIRDHRAAAATLAEDFRNCAADSPLFLISSRIGYTGNAANFANGFRNAEEQRNNRNDDPTYLDGSATATPFLQLGASDRVPRLDRLGFFARGLYRRQTTPDTQGPLATSGEAYIWVGHLKVQKNPPALPPEVETQFGADRILGRMAILLKDRSAMSNAEISAQNPFVSDSGSSTAALWPLGYDAKPFADYSDVAPLTMDQFRFRLDAQYQASALNWFRPMEDNGANSVLRFWCNPTVTRPITPRMLSQTVPFFVGNCTQFIVEYAGDYLNQDPVTGDLVQPAAKRNITPGPNYNPDENDVAAMVNPADGSTITGKTDGQIDFLVDRTADPTGTTPATWVHRIRWYGLPRDVNGDGKVDINDVLPLADVLDWYGVTVNNAPTSAPWEYDRPSPTLKKAKDYVSLQGSDAINFRYTCAWHNDAPPMIRILIKIDDPTGKLQDGQWYEYIFSR